MPSGAVADWAPGFYKESEDAMRMGWGEILLIIAVILLLFGAKKLPDLARSLGRSLSEFKKGKAEGAQPDKLDSDPPEIN